MEIAGVAMKSNPFFFSVVRCNLYTLLYYNWKYLKKFPLFTSVVANESITIWNHFIIWEDGILT